MKYNESLINITEKFCENHTMYSLILLNAKSLTFTLSGYRCFLDGKYILCLNIEDTLSVHSGYYEVLNLSFQPYFYNINLNHDLIGMEMYHEMREKYGYPDFRLFRMRDNSYFGVISISEEEYSTAKQYFELARRDIESSKDDYMWSCRARSDIISVLHIAEGVYMGKQSGLENDIIRYIYENINVKITLDDLCHKFNTNRTTVSNLIKEKTGLPPMKYILETRLCQSCPELLFTQLPINEIAQKYGFSDANYYIRTFKKRFDKSPLQFRREGWEKRIRDEGIYQRRAELEKTDMTVKEFCNYYKKGLGRAIIRLKKQADKTPFKEAFSEMLLTKEKRISHRSHDVYEKEILDVFDDKDFTERLAEELLIKLRDDMEYQNSIPLLILLGHRKKAEEIIEKRYQKVYAELLEYTKKPWDGEKYPIFAKTYMSLVTIMGRYLILGDERIKKILFDIADLYDYSENPVIPTYQDPLHSLRYSLDRRYFDMILDEVIKDHRNGKRIDIRKNFLFRFDDMPAPSFEDIMAYKEMDKDSLRLYAGFANADGETVLKTANAAIKEKDPVKKHYLLNYFIFETSNTPPSVFLFLLSR